MKQRPGVTLRGKIFFFEGGIMKKYVALLKKILVLCLAFCVIAGCSMPSENVPEDTEIEDSDDEDDDDRDDDDKDDEDEDEGIEDDETAENTSSAETLILSRRRSSDIIYLMDAGGNLAVSTHFDLATANYDLMGAVRRRASNVVNPTDTVMFRFAHLGSAVAVKVMNNSESKDVTLDSLRFQNLIVTGDAKVTLDNYGNPEMSWINTERSTAFTRVSKPVTSVPHGTTYQHPFDLMIPQRLDQSAAMGGLEADMPKLYLYYTPSGSTQKEAVLLLKDICPRDSDTPITSWAMGTKYTYEISMRLDGGVRVTVITTDWGDPIEAETPGLLIE